MHSKRTQSPSILSILIPKLPRGTHLWYQYFGNEDICNVLLGVISFSSYFQNFNFPQVTSVHSPLHALCTHALPF